ncbi:hypothetical protein [Sulfurisoma sediminicola]|uniref:Uncharacterized protein n=1 Tax=Sulfurisoma sediminicola TaxID=1381557 RepID=A0A497XAE9_9PROT|nr:hypothetical protein [Sulfurisoma sediminicola]RLJ63515.1 hypothetical protein DFR35_2139 [Sulfurisoma sediminicola]
MNARLPHPFAAIVGRLLQAAPANAAAIAIRREPPLARLAAEFGEFVGSQQSATALIQALRTGTPIVLGQPRSSASPAFSSPTGPLSYANVRIVLALARSQLAAQGLSTASPERLRWVLIGDAGADGILARRAAGFGWGRIAHALGLKLGAVVRGDVGPPTAPTAAARKPSKPRRA